jgi:hypothetical protein
MQLKNTTKAVYKKLNDAKLSFVSLDNGNRLRLCGIIDYWISTSRFNVLHSSYYGFGIDYAIMECKKLMQNTKKPMTYKIKR